MLSPIAQHIDAIKEVVSQLDNDSFELLKAGVAYRLSGVPTETDPEMILLMQDALQMVKEFPFEVTIYQLAVVVEDEDHERAGY
jgi:hypothetical protein